MTWREGMLTVGLMVLALLIAAFIVALWFWDATIEPAIAAILDRRDARRADRGHVARCAQTAFGIGHYRHPTTNATVGVTRDRAVRGGLVEDLLFEKRRQIELDRADFDLWRLECRDRSGEAS